MPWGSNSGRTSPLPRDWNSLREKCAQLAGDRCQAFDVVTRKRCTAQGTDADHIGSPNDHRIDNLRWLCGWHHDRKTAQQGLDAQREQKAKLRHPVEVHPALRDSH